MSDPVEEVTNRTLWRRVLAGASAAGAGSFVAFVESPGTWIREELVDVFFGFVGAILDYLWNVGEILSHQLYLSTWVPLSNAGDAFLDVVLTPYDVLENIGISMIDQLGIAAPFAVLIVQMVAALITVALFIVIWEFLKTYLPIESLEENARRTLATVRGQLNAMIPGGNDE